MKKIILSLLLKIIYNDSYQNLIDYWYCEYKSGCEGWYFTLIGCQEEFYSFKLNTTKCEEINGEIDFYFCDNYIEDDQDFTVEACSPSELRGCSSISCFNGKGMIRNIKDCKVEGGDFSHIKHIYYPHYQNNYYIIKEYINFGIPQQLNVYDNGKTVCSFKKQKDLIDYLVWTVKGKFVYTYGGGHSPDYYGRPSRGTSEKCPNDTNVIGFDSSGLVLYMLKMLGNKVNLGGSDCQKIYQIGESMNLVIPPNNIKAGDVLLFGNDEYKSHAAIAISQTEALEAYGYYEDENCTGMPISTRPINEIAGLYKNGKVYVVDFLQKKSFADGEKYLKDKNLYEPHPIVIKTISEFHQVGESFYLLFKSIAYEEGIQRLFSFVIYFNFSNNKKLRNLDESLKIKFYCDFNNSEKNENISELILINYNCSTDPYDNLNITEEDNLIESVELNKEEEQYFDINNVNKTMNISQINKNESSFNLENLTSYIIFTFHENKIINITNETSFILEGKTNYELSENISFELSFNNTNNFHMNCVISSKLMNNSSLYCSFNDSNLKANNNINIYSIKENEISTDDNNIFFVGLKKVEFIYEKEEENKDKIKEIIFIIIKPIIMIASIIILVGVFIIIIYFIFIRKKNEVPKPKNKEVTEVNIKSSNECSRNKIIDNEVDHNSFKKLKTKNNHK